MSFNVENIRNQFPALKRIHNDMPVVYFDGPSGSQVVESAMTAMFDYMKQGSANLGGPYLTSQESDQIVLEARKAMSDFLGGSPEEIAFGMNMTSLAFSLAHAFGRTWDEGDRIVVTEMDHRANVDTWMTIAEENGCTVDWIPLDTETLTLDYSNLNEIITEETKLVAIGHASNGIGTVNNLQPVVSRAKEVGAIVVVDAVHSAPHLYLDRERMGVDIILCSSYKFFGPHIGIASIRSELFKKLDVDRISTAHSTMPGKLETGTPSIEGLAGVTGAVNFIASIGVGESRNERIGSAFNLIHDYEQFLADKIRQYLNTRDDVSVYQAKGEKTPTIAFLVEGYTPTEIVEYLDNVAIFAGAGHFYAKTIADRLELDNGWVRIGMAPYNTIDEVDRFIQALDQL